MSQIKYAYRYGAANLRCAELINYNLFDPEDAIQSMLTFNISNCKGGFSNTAAW